MKTASQTDIKMEISQALSKKITDSRFTNKGNVVVNSETEALRGKAVVKLRKNVDQVKTKSVKKLRPKIIICNVSYDERGFDATHFDSENDNLRSIVDNGNKVEFFCKPKAGKMKNIILFF